MDTAVALPTDSLDQALASHFADLRAFVDRRIAELSAELSASVQILGMTEETLGNRIGAVHAQIAHLIAIPAAGPHNSGLELEAVVHATESAADTILEAAEAIQAWLDEGSGDTAALSERVNAIFQACAFQDLTGQRIRRAIRHLQKVESMLEGLVPAIGTQDAPRVEIRGHAPTVGPAAAAGPDLAQAEIDRLLNG